MSQYCSCPYDYNIYLQLHSVDCLVGGGGGSG